MDRSREACGRCSMSTTVDVANAGRDEDDRADPFGDERIEVDERDLRVGSPGAWLSKVADRLGSSVDRLTWGGR